MEDARREREAELGKQSNPQLCLPLFCSLSLSFFVLANPVHSIFNPLQKKEERDTDNRTFCLFISVYHKPVTSSSSSSLSTFFSSPLSVLWPSPLVLPDRLWTSPHSPHPRPSPLVHGRVGDGRGFSAL